jgi:rSAM/selenodomain-associated transferase 1
MSCGQDVIVLMAKSPSPGCVKTRMCPPLEPAQAAAVAEALLLDTADAARATGAAVWCAVAGERGRVAALLGPDIELIPQRGRDLGERLAAAQADAFASGAHRVLLLGADCPTADSDYLRTAFARLESAGVVVGPAHDGGYVLLAASAPTPGLFDQIEMGTETVLRQTLAAAADMDIPVHLLPLRHDLDAVTDLTAAFASGELEGAPRTAAWVPSRVGR